MLNFRHSLRRKFSSRIQYLHKKFNQLSHPNLPFRKRIDS
jgi:hypothetical protein